MIGRLTVQLDEWHRGRYSTADGEPPHRAPWDERTGPIASLSVNWADPEQTLPVEVLDYDGCAAFVDNPFGVRDRIIAGAVDAPETHETAHGTHVGKREFCQSAWCAQIGNTD